MKNFKKSDSKVIEIIKSRISIEETLVEKGKAQLKEVTDQEAIKVIEHDIRAHRISVLTLEDLLKSIED